MSRSEPLVRVSATPICEHLDGWYGSGEPYQGTHLVVHSDGVWVDHEKVISRDRRMKINREPFHNWIADGAPYTGFIVSVFTRKEEP